MVLMTDGRANVARDGAPGRAHALEDALRAARKRARSGSPRSRSTPRPRCAARREAPTLRDRRGDERALYQTAAAPTPRASPRPCAPRRGVMTRGAACAHATTTPSLARDATARTGRCATPAASSRPAACAGTCRCSGGGPTLLLRARHRRRDPFLARSRAAAGARISRRRCPTCPATASPIRCARAILSLPGMARALARAAARARFVAEVVVGHSAGAAILAQALHRRRDRAATARSASTAPGCRSRAWPGMSFPSMAKLLFLNPLAPRLFAWSADRHAASRLLRGTGSLVDRARRRSLCAACSPIPAMSRARSA